MFWMKQNTNVCSILTLNITFNPLKMGNCYNNVIFHDPLITIRNMNIISTTLYYVVYLSMGKALSWNWRFESAKDNSILL